MWQEISRIGKKLVQSGLVESHFGNISMKISDKIYITRSGSSLDEIAIDDVVPVSLYESCALDVIASSECIVHRTIYNSTTASCIIHAHCPYTVALSLLDYDEIVPLDSEGIYFLGPIPIIHGNIGSEELANNMACTLKNSKTVVVYGHGTFAVGRTLEEAYVFTTQAEHSSKIKYLHDLMKK